MTRRDYLAAAKELMAGAFEHVKKIDDPIIPCAGETRGFLKKKTGGPVDTVALLEALTRTFCLAAPLIREDPACSVNGVYLRDYYRLWLLKVCSAKRDDNPYAAGFYGESGGEIGQATVEGGLLVIALWICEDALWAELTKEERDQLAAYIKSQADGRTVMQNWRCFNMLMYAFLWKHGYGCSKERMRFLAEEVQLDYAGDGWYRDGQGFDYYTAWAYQIFLPVWNLWYGYEKEPDLAAGFESQCRLFIKTYDRFFDGKGRMTLWGRSGLYRAAAGVPFISTFLMPGDPGISAARAREIIGGLLKQFRGLFDQTAGRMLPSGFYGEFSPMTQSYSRRGSAYWMSMIFWGLIFSEDHPFWADDERDAASETSGDGTAETALAEADREPSTTVLDGPGIAVTAHPKSGAVSLRTGKVLRSGELDSYAKLTYRSDLPWGAEIRQGDLVIEPMQYRLFAGRTYGRRARLKAALKRKELPADTRVNVLMWGGERDGVLMRRAFFDYNTRTAWEWLYSLLLADIAMPEGILRVDRLRCPEKAFALTLGSFSLAGVSFETERAEDKEAGARAIIAKAVRPDGSVYQMAMTVYGAWDAFDVIKSDKTTPELMPALTIWGRRLISDKNREELLVSQVLCREGDTPFAHEELFPIESLTGGPAARIRLKDGREAELPYDKMSGSLDV